MLLVAALIALVTVWAGAQGVAMRVGPGDARALELVADGKPYYSLSPTGVLSNLNDATFGGTIGASVEVPHNSEWFTLLAPANKTWTVLSEDVVANNYISIGKTRLLSVDIQGTDISAGTTGNVLQIQLPFTTKKRAVSWAAIIDGGVTTNAARCLVNAGASVILCTRTDAAVFTTGTGNFGLRMQMTVEVP